MPSESEIKRELEIWENRDQMIYDVRFKKDTQADLDKLKYLIFKKSLINFVLISANSEALVYKIGRFMVENGLKNEFISFSDGRILASYIGKDSADWKKREKIDEFFQLMGEENFRGKWILMPNIALEFSPAIAIYLVMQFRKSGAAGLVYFAEGKGNLTEILCDTGGFEFFYQYPKADYYKRRKKVLKDDEW